MPASDRDLARRQVPRHGSLAALHVQRGSERLQRAIAVGSAHGQDAAGQGIGRRPFQALPQQQQASKLFVHLFFRRNRSTYKSQVKSVFFLLPSKNWVELAPLSIIQWPSFDPKVLPVCLTFSPFCRPQPAIIISFFFSFFSYLVSNP